MHQIVALVADGFIRMNTQWYTLHRIPTLWTGATLNIKCVCNTTMCIDIMQLHAMINYKTNTNKITRVGCSVAKFRAL